MESAKPSLRNRGTLLGRCELVAAPLSSLPVAQLVLVAGLEPFPLRVCERRGNREGGSLLSCRHVVIPPVCCWLLFQCCRSHERKFHLVFIIEFANVDPGQPPALPPPPQLRCPGPGTQDVQGTKYLMDVRIAAKGSAGPRAWYVLLAVSARL